MFKKILLLALSILLLGMCCTILPYAAEQTERTVFVSSAGKDTNAGTLESPFATLYAAFRALPYGGKIILCNSLNVTDTELPTSEGLITITSIGDKDYRFFSGEGNAVINLLGNVYIRSAVRFENLDIRVCKDNLLFLCNCNYVCFGENLNIVPIDDTVSYPGITAGNYGTASSIGSFVEIHSGNWNRVRGGARGTNPAPHAGGVLLAVYGGTFNGTFDMGGDSATNCDCTLLIYGGQFNASINGASQATATTTGNIYISVYGGTFNTNIRAGRGGAIDGDVTVNAFADIGKTTTIGSTKNISGALTFCSAPGVSAQASADFVTRTLTAAEADEIRAFDEKQIQDARNARIPVVGFTPMDRDFSVTGTTEKINALHSTSAFTPLVSENALDSTMTLHGGATVVNGRISSGALFGTANITDYALLSDVTVQKDSHFGLYFGCDMTNPTQMNGYCFDIDRTKNTATLFLVQDGSYRTVASRKLMMYDGNAQILAIVEKNDDGSSAVSLYYNDNPLDDAPYFIFNLNLTAKGNACGIYAENATATLPMLSSYTPSDEKTYTNVCIENFTDPEIYYENGRYYIFGASAATNSTGVKCYSTTDFSNFRDEGFAYTKGDGFGDGGFKAANVVKYGEYYYMFYMTKSEALGVSGVTAYASSKSITGPYVNPDKRPLADLTFIGGQPFVDTDGQVYLIYTRTVGGNKTYGARITLKDGVATIDVSNEVCLLVSTEPWESAKGPIVECGYIIRHGDTYYLMYSGGAYNSTYGTGFATSKNPLGPYSKYEFNPILVSNDQAFGVGASSIFASPDGSEHFIVYLRNFSPTKARPLCTCIDRIKFVKDPNGGEDILTVQGPTVTPQPLPSNITGTTENPDYQTTRFIW